MKINKLIRIVKKTLVLVVLFSSFYFTSCNVAHSYGLPKKIGDAEATFSGDEILIKNFPRYRQGIVGLNEVDFGTFSFNELDKFVYEIAKNSSLYEIYITIQYTEEDKYGKKTDGEKITIGKVNVSDSKQYADFEHWNQIYSSSKMFWKDKQEYDKQVRKINTSSFIPAYSPKDIRNITPWVIDENSLIDNSPSVDSTNNNSYSEKTNNDDKYLEEKRNEEERIAGELRWTNPVYLKSRMDEIVFKILGEDNIQTGAQFNLVCQESEEFYKLINRYMELTGENPY